MIASICLASSDFSCSGSESESLSAGFDNWGIVQHTGAEVVSRKRRWTDLIVELDGFDHPLIGIEQCSDKLFLLDKLDVSDHSPSSSFGLVQVLLYLWTLLYRFVLPVHVLPSQHEDQPDHFGELRVDSLYMS